MLEKSIQWKYEKAVRNPDQRQQFLDELDVTEVYGFIRGIYYKKVPSRGNYEYTMLTRPNFLRLFGKKRTKSKIIVFSKAFETCLVNDFLSDLIDHEGFHARELYVGNNQPEYFFEVDGLVIDCMGEIRALHNQIRNFKRRGVSKNQETRIHDKIELINAYFDSGRYFKSLG